MTQAEKIQQALRALPAVDELLGEEAVRAEAEGLAPRAVTLMAREAIEACRTRIREAAQNGAGPGDEDSVRAAALERCLALLRELRAPRLVPAINATGIIIHTGMGRSPLAEEAIEAIRATAGGYSDVAISRATGGRRKRSGIVEKLLQLLTGCEAALVVNNNAAAVLLALAAHAKGREVVVSRGQLVEIGGSFRLPDVMKSAGVRLVEVGTTNRTRLTDFEAAIGQETAALMRIHPSNFRLVGFTESVEPAELFGLARSRGLVAIDDIGSGALIDFSPYGLTGETTVRQSIEAGADLTLFSADKLLGGPQAGVLAGRRAAVEVCAADPLVRALRVDKLTMAALEATLRLYLEPARLTERLPLVRMIAEDEAAVKRRAKKLRRAIAKALPQLKTTVESDVAYVGGGALPDESLPSWIVAVADPPGGAEELRRRLRLGEPSVFARVRRERLEFDLRTVADREISGIVTALDAASA